MVKASSDGFIPSDFTSLFGAKSAELISLNLGLDMKAPVVPNSTWREHIPREINIILAELHDISHRYQMYFESDLLTALAEICNSPLITAMRTLPSVKALDVKPRIQYPVLNIIPIETLESLLQALTPCIETVRLYASRLNTRIQVNIPTEIFRDDVAPMLGDSRYVGKPGPPMIFGDRFPPKEQMEQVDGAGWIQEA
jgi:hypothetical protein